jgi:hypothetical protein
MPFPNLQVLSDNIKFFIENNVYGIFEQGNVAGRNGEFAELRPASWRSCSGSRIPTWRI